MSKCNSLTVHLALLPLTSKRGYNAQCPAIHRLNDDILLYLFDSYRLGEEYRWNRRFFWLKLFHVCQRWRHVFYKCAFHLGIQIKCSNGSPIVDALTHLPPLPLFVPYGFGTTEQDVLGIYRALRLHGRVYHIELVLWPSILRQVVVLLDQHFPILEHLSLSYPNFSNTKNSLPLTLPKNFLAPNLCKLILPSISTPRRLRVFTSTKSLVRLVLNNIRASSYFRPRLIVACVASLPNLRYLTIEFSVPIPGPRTERRLLGEQRTPVALPSLEMFWFKGVGAYLESLVSQIRAPLLEHLSITLFNQIAFALPHLSYLINITKAFKLPYASVHLGDKEVFVSVGPVLSAWSIYNFSLHVICKPLDWQIDCAAQICHELIPALPCVEKLSLSHDPFQEIPTEWQNGAIDSATWHDLLR